MFWPVEVPNFRHVDPEKRSNFSPLQNYPHHVICAQIWCAWEYQRIYTFKYYKKTPVVITLQNRIQREIKQRKSENEEKYPSQDSQPPRYATLGKNQDDFHSLGHISGEISLQTQLFVSNASPLALLQYLLWNNLN